MNLSPFVILAGLISIGWSQGYRNDITPEDRKIRTYSAPLQAAVEKHRSNLPKLLDELQHLAAAYEIDDFSQFTNRLLDEKLVVQPGTRTDGTEELTIILTPSAKIYGVPHQIDLEISRIAGAKECSVRCVARQYPQMDVRDWNRRAVYPNGSFLRTVQQLIARKRELRPFWTVNEVKVTCSHTLDRWTSLDAWIYSVDVTLVENNVIPPGTRRFTFFGVSGYRGGINKNGNALNPIGFPLRGDVPYSSLPPVAVDRSGGKIWEFP